MTSNYAYSPSLTWIVASLSAITYASYCIMNLVSVASKSLSPSSPYNSLIPRIKEVVPPTTYGDPSGPPITYLAITLIGGGGDFWWHYH